MGNRVELGDKVRDAISGWEGIAVGRYEYINGCVRIGIGGKTKEGAPEEYIFDEQQVDILEKAAFSPYVTPEEEAATRSVGGPRSTSPARRSTPPR